HGRLRRPCPRTGPSPLAAFALSLHDALPISSPRSCSSTDRCPFWLADEPAAVEVIALYDRLGRRSQQVFPIEFGARVEVPPDARSEEHTSELQSLRHLVCRLLLEK